MAEPSDRRSTRSRKPTIHFVNLFIMAEPSDRRSTRSRKPTIHFDDKIAQSLVPKKPKASTKSAKPAKPAKPTKKLLKPSISPTLASSTEPVILDNAVEELCSQIEGLNIKEDPKTKKKVKVVEITRLTALNLQGVIEEVKPLEDI